MRAVVGTEGCVAHGRRPAIGEKTGVVTVGGTGSQGLVVGIGAIPETGTI